MPSGSETGSAQKSAEFANRGGDSVSGRAPPNGKDFRWIDEGGRVRLELGEEITHAEDDGEWQDEALDAGMSAIVTRE